MTWNRRQFLKIAGVSATASLTVSQQAIAETNTKSESTIELVEADSEKGFHFPYLLRRPSSSGSPSNSGPPSGGSTRPLLVRCPFRGKIAQRDKRMESARTDLERGLGRFIGEKLRIPVSVALLPSRRDNGSPANLDHEALQIADPPLKRLDLQLLAMIEDARNRLAIERYDVPESVHLDGFSVNGEFFERFTMLHPERVNAASTGGNGAITIPKSTLDSDIPTIGDPSMVTLLWPVGVAKLDELIGQKFDMDAWMKVDQYRYIGREDQWDPDQHDHPRDYIHAQTYRSLGEMRQQLLLAIFGWEQVDERFKTSRKIYQNIEAPVESKIYDGVGHKVTSEIASEIVEFHRKHAVKAFGLGETSTQTPQETTAQATTPQASNPTATTDASQPETTTGQAPGFSVIHTISALAGLSYLRYRRMKKG